MGRLINHSKISQNVKPVVVSIDNTPRIVFVASKTIKAGEELLYDYGDRRREVIEKFPWLRN